MADCISMEDELHIEVTRRCILDKVLICEDELIQDLCSLFVYEDLEELIRDPVAEALNNIEVKIIEEKEDDLF